MASLILEYYNFFLMVCWVIVWIIFYVGGQKKRTVDTNKKLKAYSTYTFVLIFFFYSILFYGPQFYTIYIPEYVLLYIGIPMTLLGVITISLARLSMKNISFIEIFLSINPQYSTSGIYKYFEHPMYIGIFLILIGSWFFKPDILLLILVASVSVFIQKKVNVEKFETK